MCGSQEEQEQEELLATKDSFCKLYCELRSSRRCPRRSCYCYRYCCWRWQARSLQPSVAPLAKGSYAIRARGQETWRPCPVFGYSFSSASRDRDDTRKGCRRSSVGQPGVAQAKAKDSKRESSHSWAATREGAVGTTHHDPRGGVPRRSGGSDAGHPAVSYRRTRTEGRVGGTGEDSAVMYGILILLLVCCQDTASAYVRSTLMLIRYDGWYLILLSCEP